VFRPSPVGYGPASRFSSISLCEGDDPGANPGFLTNKNENAQRALKGDWPIRKRILLREQSQPRLKDLNAGI
jgi:hypothetical protein